MKILNNGYSDKVVKFNDIRIIFFEFNDRTMMFGLSPENGNGIRLAVTPKTFDLNDYKKTDINAELVDVTSEDVSNAEKMLENFKKRNDFMSLSLQAVCMSLDTGLSVSEFNEMFNKG